MSIHDWQAHYERAIAQETKTVASAQIERRKYQSVVPNMYAVVDTVLAINRGHYPQFTLPDSNMKRCVCGAELGSHANPYGQIPLACPNPKYVNEGGDQFLKATFQEEQPYSIMEKLNDEGMNG